MPNQYQPLTYNTFEKGIITEASPISFPDGASIDESNFELNKQGYRTRRLGLDDIVDPDEVDVAVTGPSDITTYLWDNSGVTSQQFLIVGVRGVINIYDVTDDLPGESLIYTTEVDYNDSLTTPLSFASHEGALVIANGASSVTIIRSLGDNLFSKSEEALTIRDVVGIPAYASVEEDYSVEPLSLLKGSNVQKRPVPLDLHLNEDWDGGSSDVYTETYTLQDATLVAQENNDSGTTLRYEASISQDYPSFKGFPIATFILESVDDASEFFLHVVFKETYPAAQLSSYGDPFTTEDGLAFVLGVSESDFNDYRTGSLDVSLTESSKPQHPHIYNLWNQGWGEWRMTYLNSTTLIQPVDNFYEYTDLLPASSDTVGSVLYANANADANRTAYRFHPLDLEANPLGTATAPQGHYIINALDRGASRISVYTSDLEDKGIDSALYPDSGLSLESTSGGATTVAQYAGRIWYGGFTGDSPGSTLRLSNKILYGQTTTSAETLCYQEADPTSTEDSALVDTDGGWVTINGIEEVVRLVATDTSLVVFATNGVWVIAGTDGNTFAPTSSLVSKITDKGTVCASSIVTVDSDIYFWTLDGLYRLVSEGFADFKLEPLTKATINDLVLELTYEDFVGMSGAYDARRERISWILDGQDGLDSRRELVYHLPFSSFTINTYNSVTVGSVTNELLATSKVPQFFAEESDTIILDNSGDTVVDEDDNTVVELTSSRSGSYTQQIYIGVSSYESGDERIRELTFLSPVREDFMDWGTSDASAYLLTGYVSGGDTTRFKQVPKLVLHFNRTETTATETGVENESSCLVQSQWEWTNDAYSNKWSDSFQGYRLPRPQIRGIGELVAEGIEVVTTRNKLRGRGRTVSLLFSTEEEKDCQILGWTLLTGVNDSI